MGYLLRLCAHRFMEIYSTMARPNYIIYIYKKYTLAQSNGKFPALCGSRITQFDCWNRLNANFILHGFPDTCSGCANIHMLMHGIRQHLGNGSPNGNMYNHVAESFAPLILIQINFSKSKDQSNNSPDSSVFKFATVQLQLMELVACAFQFDYPIYRHASAYTQRVTHTHDFDVMQNS